MKTIRNIWAIQGQSSVYPFMIFALSKACPPSDVIKILVHISNYITPAILAYYSSINTKKNHILINFINILILNYQTIV